MRVGKHYVRLDEFDFAEQRRKLRLWAAEAPTAKPNPCSACKYCPAKSVCPEGPR